MIEINLLPQELRVSTDKKAPEYPLVLIGSLLLATAIIVSLFFSFSNKGVASKYSELEARASALKEGRKQAAALSSEIKVLEDRLEVTKKIASPKVDWAEMLSGLNESMIPNLWLTGFMPQHNIGSKNRGAIDQNNLSSLEITGFAVGRSEATSIVGRFIQSLKKNKRFYQYFKDIDMRYTERRNVEEKDVMFFKLVCKFKEQ